MDFDKFMMKSEFLDSLNFFMWRFRHRFSPKCDYEYDSQGEVVHQYTPIQWTRDALVLLGLSSVCGSLLGILVAVGINTVMVEIPMSPSFTFYSSLLFILIGVLILRKLVFYGKNYESQDESLEFRTPRHHLFIFAILIVTTGILCLFLKRDSLVRCPFFFRLVVYGMLGMSTAFALTYALVDVVNCVVGFLKPGSARPLVESVLQIYVVIVSSLLLGLVFGIFFGARDISQALSTERSMPGVSEEDKIFVLNFVDERLCIFTGILWGGLTGLANEYIARVESSYNRLDQPVGFDQDI